MARLFIVLPLVLVLGVSPILPSFLEYICCCNDTPKSSHYHAEEDGHHDHDHGADPVPTQASHHSDDAGEHAHGSHHEHGSEQPASGFNIAASASASAPEPNSCSCDQADGPAALTLALSQVSKTSRKSTKTASGHQVLAIRIAEDRTYTGIYALHARKVTPSAPDRFLLNRALLL